MTVYNNLIDTNLPDGGDDPAEADNNMRRIQAGFQEILAVEHNVDLTGTVITGDAGHKDITTLSIVNDGALVNNGDVTINTNKFTIDAETGNVVVAGTLDVAGAAEIIGVATLGDASLLKTSAAPTTDPMIANKKYVDDTPHTGGIVQVVNTQTGAVNTGTTVMPYDDTIPQITEGDEYMTLAITPTSATNKLKIEVVGHFSESTGGVTTLSAALFKDAVAGALAATFSQNGTTYPEPPLCFTHYMVAGTTNEIIFRVRAGKSGGGATVTFNGSAGVRKFGGVLASSITITEIKV